jgi:PAS domain S-box-containing protein
MTSNDKTGNLSDADARRLIECAQDIVLLIDAGALTIRYANGGACRQLGAPIEQWIGQPFWALLPSMSEPLVRARFRELLPGEDASLSFETEFATRDGNHLPVEIMLQRFSGTGKAADYLAICRDLTERRRIDRMKSEFISNVSHELRTPLTSISGSLGLVNGGVVGELPPQAKAMIEIACNSSERLVRLINDILDIEKIESGKMTFDLRVVPLMPLIEQALAATHAYAEQYGVRFALAEVVADAQVKADEDRLSQVLTNLLSNAAKFSPEDECVTIDVKRVDGLLRVSVTDCGSGIPESFHDRIFQKFSQADTSETKEKGGSGLGLSISKAIIERMGGAIGFTSETGKGSTFYFTLPPASHDWSKP